MWSGTVVTAPDGQETCRYLGLSPGVPGGPVEYMQLSATELKTPANYPLQAVLLPQSFPSLVSAGKSGVLSLCGAFRWITGLSLSLTGCHWETFVHSSATWRRFGPNRKNQRFLF